MSDLTTIIAELEEAERAASPGPWRCQMDKNNLRCLIAYDDTWSKDLTLGAVWSSINDEPPANARLIALMRNSLPTLIEAVKRQGKALEWYETHVRDCRKITKDGDAARHALDKDGGERARAALKEATGG